jgi:hypothetical protein
MSQADLTAGRCPRTTDVGAYLLGGLVADEAAEMRDHMDGCVTCSREMSELQTITDQLAQVDLRSFAGLPVDEPSEDLRERILVSALAESGDDQESGKVVSNNVVSLQPGERKPGEPKSGGRRRVGWKAAASVGVAFALGAGSGYVAKPAAAPPKRPYFGTGTNDISQRVNFVSSNTTGPKAWANVSSGPAGTYAALYTKGLAPGTYRWWFEKKDGTRVALGSFEFPEKQTKWVICPGGTSVERIELTAIGATDANGKDVLRADLPAPATS